MFKIVYKLKLLKAPIRKLNATVFRNIHHKVIQAQQASHHIQEDIHEHLGQLNLLVKEKELLEQYQDQLQAERVYL
mgnify:CR=1 FL=1